MPTTVSTPLSAQELGQLNDGIQKWIVNLSNYLGNSTAGQSIPVLGKLTQFVATEQGELTAFGKALSDAIAKATTSNKVPTLAEVNTLLSAAFKTAGIPVTFTLAGNASALTFSFNAKSSKGYSQALDGEIGLGSLLSLKSGGTLTGHAGFELKFSGGADSLGSYIDTKSNRSSLNLFTKDDLTGIRASGLAGGVLNTNVSFSKGSLLDASLNLALGTSDSLAGGIVRLTDSLNALGNLTVTPSLGGNLDLDMGVSVNLKKTVGTKNLDLLPLNSQEVLHWNFASQSTPNIEIKNTTLALGPVFETGGLLANILTSAANVAGKINPLVQGLTKNIPGISDSSFIDFVTSSKDLTDQEKQDIRDFVDLLQQATTFVKDIPKIDPAATIRLPDYRITGEAAPALAYAPSSDPSANAPVMTEESTGQSIIPQAVRDFLTKISLGSYGTLSLPILSDPSALARLIIGQEVDLLSWNLPSVDKTFSASIDPFAPIPSIPVSLAAGISAHITENLGIGYDSRGLLSYQSSDKLTSLLDGIYLYNTTGTNTPPLHADFNFTPSISAGLGDAIGATVNGSVSLGGDVNLMTDSLGVAHPFANGTFVDGINAPLSGSLQLSGQLQADLKVGIFSKEVEILPNTVLYSYSFPSNALVRGPVTTLTGGNLQLNVGTYATLNGNYENPAGGDTLTITHKKGKLGAETLTAAVNGSPFTSYAATKTLVGSASSGNLTIIEKKGSDKVPVLAPLVFTGGDSNLTYVGGGGNDTLTMGNGNNTITPGTGTKNVIQVGSGTNLIHLGLGSASVAGGSNTTVAFDLSPKAVFVDLATASLDGGAKGSHITGAPNVTGTKFSDTLIGGGVAGVLFGGKGDDFLVSGPAGATLVGAQSGSPKPGLREIDSLAGATGSDLFILGDASSAYYLSGSTRGGGRGDYALIRHFDPTEDRLQLKGNASLYSASVLTIGGQQGLAIYYDSLGSGAKSELISIIQPDSTHTLTDLNVSNTVQVAQFV